MQRVSRKVAPEGTAMDDWRIAVELAVRLGHDVDLATVDEVTDEIAAVAPAFAGVTAALMQARTRRRRPAAARRTATSSCCAPRELSIMADDGSGTSWDPIKVEGADVEADEELAEALATEPEPAPEAPALHVWDGATPSNETPARDAYALRLVVGRTLYDDGRIVSETPLLASSRAASPCCASTRATRRASASSAAARCASRRRAARRSSRVEPDAGVPAGHRALRLHRRRRRARALDRREPRRSPTCAWRACDERLLLALDPLLRRRRSRGRCSPSSSSRSSSRS